MALAVLQVEDTVLETKHNGYIQFPGEIWYNWTVNFCTCGFNSHNYFKKVDKHADKIFN